MYVCMYEIQAFNLVKFVWRGGNRTSILCPNASRTYDVGISKRCKWIVIVLLRSWCGLFEDIWCYYYISSTVLVWSNIQCIVGLVLSCQTSTPYLIISVRMAQDQFCPIFIEGMCGCWTGATLVVARLLTLIVENCCAKLRRSLPGTRTFINCMTTSKTGMQLRKDWF